MLQGVGDYNRLLVLKTIRAHGPISRIELAAATGLAGATITDLTGDLVRRGLITERRQDPSGKGRPRVLLQVKADAAVVIGASISPRDTLKANFSDLAGNVLHSDEARIGRVRTIAAMAVHYSELLQQMVRAAPIARSDIAMVALSIPAIIDSTRGVVHWVTTLPAQSTPFAAIVAKKLRLPVITENEVDGLARAEHWFGRRAPRDNFSLVYFGLHIALASYADGRPHDGVNGISPEFGHVKVAYGDDARPCYCGARGCLTCYGLIGSVVELIARRADGMRPFQLDLLDAYHEVIRSAAAGQARALAIIEAAGTHLGGALANYINTCDPGHILILAESPGLPELLRGSLDRALKAHALPAILERTTIAIDAVDSDWRSKGAAALALEHAYTDDEELRARRRNRRLRRRASKPGSRGRRSKRRR